MHRWINPDPAGDVNGLNLFMIVGNNPIGFIDSDGRMLRRSNQINSNEPHEGGIDAQKNSSNVVAFPASAPSAKEEDGAVREKAVDFFRVDLGLPSDILTNGFRGNNTERVMKVFGDD